MVEILGVAQRVIDIAVRVMSPVGDPAAPPDGFARDRAAACREHMPTFPDRRRR